MPAFTMPLTIATGDGQVTVAAHLARPLPWSAVRADVCRAADLSEDAVLYCGVGAVEDTWMVGSPPLVAGCFLATVPDNEWRSNSPLLLTVVAGPDAGGSVAVESARIVLGRSDRADLRLTDPAVSWQHASLTPAPTGLRVVDLGSTNGTYLDGTPVTSPALAGTGSVVRVGNTVLQVQLAAEPPGQFQPDGQGHLLRLGRAVSILERAPTHPVRPTAPQPAARRALPILSALIGAAVGGTLAFVLHNAMYLAFAAFGPVTMIGQALSDRLRGRRSLRRERREYRKALRQWESESAIACAAERRRAWRLWPGPAGLLRRAESASARLWSMPTAGGLYVAIGSATTTRSPHTEAPAGNAPNGAEPVTIPDVPAATRLGGIVGLVGPPGRGLARYVVAQIACHYSPTTVSLVVITDEPDLGICRVLPHATVVTDTNRAEAPRFSDRATPETVVILDGPDAIHSPVGAAALRAADASGGASGGLASAFADPPTCVSVMCLVDAANDAPPGAVDIVAAARAGGGGPISVTQARAAVLQRICRALAPLRDDVAADPAALPRTVDLVELMGPVDPVSVRRRWSRPPHGAVLGMGADAPVAIDLDAEGPHLLIAGTTGSGKSELLQTLVTSLAIGASPQAVTFLLVDYKGGSAFGAIATLPHVVGVLTDLDPAGSARALSSLRAELRQRERWEAAGAGPAAKLILIIDEFATLAAELPEFLSGVLDIAQRGRSLGLHLVLATQRPAGVVSPAMRANISARICLRVTDPAESLDVLGAPDAAALPADRPGRAILRANGRIVPFQSAVVSVAPRPDFSVSIVHKAGHHSRAQGAERGTRTAASHTRTTVLADAIAATREAARDLPPPRRPWLPPLPSVIDPTTVDANVLAIADIPDEQRRGTLPLPDASSLVLGPPGSGRSTALRRVAQIAAQEGHEVIVIDGGDRLAPLAHHAAVSTYLTLREPRLITRTLTLLGDSTRRPPDQHLRHVLIDNLDMVLGELERSDYSTGSAIVSELISRGGGTVRITASGPERLRHQRAASGFTEIIELAGGHAPGRGTWSGQLVQFVDAAGDSGEMGGVGRVEIRGVPRDSRIVVRPLPIRTDIASLPAPAPNCIPFAIGGDAAEPIALDLTGPGGGILVSGPRRSGVSETLRVIAEQAAVGHIPVVRLDIGHVASASTPPGIVAITCHQGTDRIAEFLRAHQGPILLVADHHSMGDDHPAAPLLERFLGVCGVGQYLLVGARTEAVVRSRRGHLRSVASYRIGALLAPDHADGPILDVSLPRRDGPLIPGRGIWATDGVATPIQVATSM